MVLQNNYQLNDAIEIINISNTIAILSFKASIPLFTAGFCKINCIHGKCMINGYQCSSSASFQEINCSRWEPCTQIKPLLSRQDHINISKLSKDITLKINHLCDNQNEIIINKENLESLKFSKCIIIIKGYSDNEIMMNWMLNTEDHSDYIKMISSLSSSLSTNNGIIEIPELCCLTSSCLIGTEDWIKRSGLEIINISTTWNDAIDEIYKSKINTNQINQINETEQIGDKIVICGAKGVGKSTLLKYTVNRLLKKYNKVAIIDCDVGQPLFTISGLVSISIIDNPLLSSTHLSLIEPELSYFIGDISPKNDPENLLNYIEKLYNKYIELNQQMIKMKNDQYLKNTQNNIFNALSTTETSESTIESIANMMIPLVVNTDGWVRYIGAEILQGIVNIIKPNHIFHISTPKDRNLSALNSINSQKCKISTLLPGSTSPSKISAIDLRNLNFISYFLKSCNMINICNDYYKSQYQDGSNAIIIKNAHILDPSGILHFAFTNLKSIFFEIDKLRINNIKDVITSSKLNLQLLSNTIVGILNQNEKYIGIGYLIMIDNKNLKLQIPENLYDIINSIKNDIFFIKSNLYLPSQLITAPWLATFPYQSSEISGEGSQIMKARTNLKRKF